MSSVEERIDQFKMDAITRSPRDLIGLHLHGMEPYAITRDQYHDLRSELATHFGMHARDVVLVGSGQLGFTLKEDELFRYFGDDSDLDIAIINQNAFIAQWKSLHQWVNFNPGVSIGGFSKYLFRGWIRPDMLPVGFPEKKDWFEYFTGLTASGKYGSYKISCGIYFDDSFFESYQSLLFSNVIQILKQGNP